ncbi:unnamed protein product [Strongylus vulgaris]|uniref:ATP synthase peripheral stalk subunit OSCP, mitochondrial n=1 Tax=Strongylus vulgaris TaxID=40348 RepID=A0A3P7JZU3_STRVU|nr:unnamed protein product [Strongylus vulgaris]
MEDSGAIGKSPASEVHGVEGRYAAALYSAAYKQKSLDKVDKDLQKIREVYQQDKNFQEFILNPTLKGSKKKQTVLSIAQKLGLSKESTNFLGELFVQVTSAEPLSKSYESALNDALHKMAKSGQKLNVTYNVKPSILGGLIVNIGDKYVDLSIASRVKKLKEVLVASV